MVVRTETPFWKILTRPRTNSSTVHSTSSTSTTSISIDAVVPLSLFNQA